MIVVNSQKYVDILRWNLLVLISQSDKGFMEIYELCLNSSDTSIPDCTPHALTDCLHSNPHFDILESSSSSECRMIASFERGKIHHLASMRISFDMIVLIIVFLYIFFKALQETQKEKDACLLSVYEYAATIPVRIKYYWTVHVFCIVFSCAISVPVLL